MLPDRSVFIGQKLMKIAKIQKFKCDILSNFQTMCQDAPASTQENFSNVSTSDSQSPGRPEFLIMSKTLERKIQEETREKMMRN